jgi:hypothetical protein
MKIGTWRNKTVLIAEMCESATNLSINKSGRAATGNTFVQFYPTLIETAKQHGTHKER